MINIYIWFKSIWFLIDFCDFNNLQRIRLYLCYVNRYSSKLFHATYIREREKEEGKEKEISFHIQYKSVNIFLFSFEKTIGSEKWYENGLTWMLKKCDFEEYLVFFFFLIKSFLFISQEDTEKEHIFIVVMKDKFSKIERVYRFVYHRIPTHFLAKKTHVTYKDS